MINKLNHIIDEYIQKYNLSCSIYIKLEENIIERTNGLADRELNKQITLDSFFPIASITKTIFTVTFLKALDFYKFNLSVIDKPLNLIVGNDFWVGYKLTPPKWFNEITIKQCLSHTSGLPCLSDGLEFWSYHHEHLSYKNQLKLLSELKQENKGRFHYSNAGFWLVSIIFKHLFKIHWYEFALKHVFEPLGLKEIYYLKNSTRNNPLNLPGNLSYAYGYTYDNNQFTKCKDWSLDFAGPAYGLVSNITQIAKFFSGFLEGNLLTSNSKKLMLTPIECDYGLGINIVKMNGKTVYYHNGGMDGMSSSARYIPDKNATIVILGNSTFDYTEYVKGLVNEKNLSPNSLEEELEEALYKKLPQMKLNYINSTIYKLTEELISAITKS
ncbi:MAG: serine hydrolase [Sphingobacteriia bacterium]|nr:serine hydrolase [Sphingobacteriia bacterium]